MKHRISRSRNCYLLVIIFYFSKSPELVVLSNQESQHFPRLLLISRLVALGTQQLQIFQQLYDILGPKKTTTTSLHPRRSKGSFPKPKNSWEGPYNKEINNVIYRIQKTTCCNMKVVHADQLALYQVGLHPIDRGEQNKGDMVTNSLIILIFLFICIVLYQ